MVSLKKKKKSKEKEKDCDDNTLQQRRKQNSIMNQHNSKALFMRITKCLVA